MLWALGQPAALVGLVVGFAVALAVRAAAQHLALRRVLGRSRLLDVRRDFDIFGAVAAVIGGTGWGRKSPDVGASPPPLAVLLAGPAAVLIASQVAFAGYRVAGGDPLPLRVYAAADVLRGVPGSPLPQALLSFAVGLLAFGFLALLPLPPLDGWVLLRRSVRRPGSGFQRARYWLEEQNIGVVILLVGLILPLVGGLPLLLLILNVVTLPVLRAWS